jgi:hypothetical protein
MPFNDVCDSVGSEIDFSVSTHIYFSKLEKIIGELEELQKIENNRDYRDKVKDEIREKIIELLSKISEIDEIKNSINSLKSQLNKLEINFEQQLKGQKVN